MKKTIYLITLFIVISVFCKAQYTPIAVTGYDVDAVAENTTSLAFTTAGLDGGGFVLFNTYYGSLFTPTTTGLPNNGTIINGADTYQMAPYNQNNIMLLLPGTADSLVLITPGSFMSLSFMNFGTDGIPTMSLTIRYTDNSTQTYANVTVQDWFNGTGAVISNFDRTVRTSGTPAYATGNPRFYSSTYLPSCTNRSKQIRAFLIKNTSTSAKLCIAGVSGIAPAVYNTTVSPVPCTGSTGSIGLIVTGGLGPFTYSWSTSPAQTSSAAISLTVGSYNYSVTDASSCTYTGTAIMPPNTGAQSAPTVGTYINPICSGMSQIFNAQGAASYTWTGGVSNGIAFTPTIGANLQVVNYTVTGANSCNTSTASTVITLTINPSPTITASSTTPSLCSGNTVALTGGGSTSSYTWTGGVSDGVAFAPTVTTTYSVSGSNTIGCTATNTITIPVVLTPTSLPTATPAFVCLGRPSTITAVGAANYTWLPGTGTSSSIVINPVATTIYTVTKANGNCVDTKTISIAVYSLPTINISSNTTTLCAGSVVTLQAQSAGAFSYSWTPVVFTTPLISVSPTVNTTYTASAFNGSCSNQATIALSTVAIPTITSVSSTSAICLGETATLTANGALGYTWNPGGIVSATAVVSPNSSVQYSAIGYNSFGCTAISSQIIVVNQPPSLTVSQSDPVICAGNTATLTASSSVSTYTWNNANNNSSIVVSPNISTIYSVSSIGSNSCTATQTLLLDVVVSSVTISGSNSICAGQSTTLFANGAGTYTWSTGFQGNFIQVTPAATIIYTVSATTTSLNISCNTDNTVQVAVNALPIIIVTATRKTICKDETSVLTATGASSYTWSNGANTSSIIINPSFASVTNYTVIGSSSLGCKNTAGVVITTNPCTGLEKNTITAQQLNIFPNPSNGSFSIQFEGKLNILIFNALGQLIRESVINDDNNYKLQVMDLKPGIYWVSGFDGNNKIVKKVIVE